MTRATVNAELRIAEARRPAPRGEMTVREGIACLILFLAGIALDALALAQAWPS